MSTTALYDNYDSFKGWSATPAAAPDGTFEAVLAPLGRAERLRILEIGFGDGAFLDWARDRGHRVSGTEIRSEAVEAARSRGHDVHFAAPDLSGLDLVVALDVLEHMTVEQILETLATANRVLRPGGRVVARFPNGSSPFSGHFQNGDATHVRSLNRESLSQLAAMAGFEVEYAGNFRPMAARSKSRLKSRAAFLVRDLVETVLGLAYFGQRIPMDPNLLAVLRRASDSNTGE